MEGPTGATDLEHKLPPPTPFRFPLLPIAQPPPPHLTLFFCVLSVKVQTVRRKPRFHVQLEILFWQNTVLSCYADRVVSLCSSWRMAERSDRTFHGKCPGCFWTKAMCRLFLDKQSNNGNVLVILTTRKHRTKNNSIAMRQSLMGVCEHYKHFCRRSI